MGHTPGEGQGRAQQALEHGTDMPCVALKVASALDRTGEAGPGPALGSV